MLIAPDAPQTDCVADGGHTCTVIRVDASTNVIVHGDITPRADTLLLFTTLVPITVQSAIELAVAAMSVPVDAAPHGTAESPERVDTARPALDAAIAAATDAEWLDMMGQPWDVRLPRISQSMLRTSIRVPASALADPLDWTAALVRTCRRAGATPGFVSFAPDLALPILCYLDPNPGPIPNAVFLFGGRSTPTLQ